MPDFTARIDDAQGARSARVSDLRRAAAEQERAWQADHGALMAGDPAGDPVRFRAVQRLGPFALHRFLPPFDRSRPGQHIGELITDHKGAGRRI